MIANANNGVYGNEESWLAAAIDTDPFIGLNFNGSQQVSSITGSISAMFGLLVDSQAYR